MKKLGIKKLKYYIASHGHKNHIGGAAPIIEAFAPDAVYVPRKKVVEAVKKYASGAKEKQAVAQANYVVLKRGDAFTLGEAVFTCIGPLKFKNCSCGAYAENYNSGILRGAYKGRSILLTGDTSDAKLSNIHEDTPGAIKAEVYKNHHHNGRTGLAVLKKISPQIVVVCNSGAPSSSYQKTIKEVGAKLYTAAKKCEGDVVLYTRGTKWEYGLPPQEAEGESGEEGETGMATKASAERVIAQA